MIPLWPNRTLIALEGRVAGKDEEYREAQSHGQLQGGSYGPAGGPIGPAEEMQVKHLPRVRTSHLGLQGLYRVSK